MNLLGEKVKHIVFGIGTVTEQKNSYIYVEFPSKTCQFTYPSAFEKFLMAENTDLQTAIQNEIDEVKVAESEKKKAEEVARKAEEERRKALSAVTSSKSRNIDAMFGEDYHVEHLAREPILTYQQVEKKFGIKISGFGRGINSTPTTVVLISSMRKTKQSFIYHDNWTENGDYIYSGEGKKGDQMLTKGNLAIVNAAKDKKPIHLFIKLSPKEYYDQGIFKLVEYTYENEKDEHGNTRKVYKFRLRKAK